MVQLQLAVPAAVVFSTNESAGKRLPCSGHWEAMLSVNLHPKYVCQIEATVWQFDP
jgi:hypothetical protein